MLVRVSSQTIQSECCSLAPLLRRRPFVVCFLCSTRWARRCAVSLDAGALERPAPLLSLDEHNCVRCFCSASREARPRPSRDEMFETRLAGLR